MSNKINVSTVKLGSDIEWFLQDRNTNEIVSAEGYAKGTKKRPFVFDNSSPFWATSLDNVSYEGNIPPVEDKLSWYKNIQRLKEHIDSTLPANLCTIAIPSYEFDPKWLRTKNARTFGCEATLNCWTRSTNEAPSNRTNLRSTGMHIHASWEDMNIEAIEAWIKTMDLFLGVPSVIIEPENKRRTPYGKAGEFRMSDRMDRAEYRVLSSYFASSEELINYSYDQTFKAFDFINEGNEIDIEGKIADDIRAAINNSDKKIAEKLIKEFNIPVLV